MNYRGSRLVVGGLTSKNKIDILIYIARELASVNRQQQLFDRALALCAEIFEAENIHLRLWNEAEQRLRVVRSLHPATSQTPDIASGEGVSGTVYVRNEALLLADLLRAEPAADAPSSGCLICVPIVYKSIVLGTLTVEQGVSHFYRKDDLEILEALSAQLGLALNEVRLLEGLFLANQRIEFDLRMGRNVQSQIIPRRIDAWNGLHFFFHYAPMTEVSGDYLRVFRDEKSTTLFIADVSGHGVAAAMVTMIIHHQLDGIIDSTNALPEIFEELNERIRPNLPEGVYFTAQIIRIYEDHTYGFVNAGHVRLVLLRRDGETCDLLDTPGLPLGITDVRKEDFPMATGRLSEGDILCMMSDGFTEQKNTIGEETGTPRFLEWMLEERRELRARKEYFDASEIGLSLLSRFEQFRRGAPTGDDLSLILLEVSPLLPDSRAQFLRARQVSDLKEKLDLCEQVYNTEPSLLPNLLYMGRLLYKLQDFPRAESVLRQYLDTSGTRNVEIIYLTGSTIKRQGRLREARKYFRRALAVQPTHLPSLLRMVRSYLREQRPEDALLVLNQAVHEGLHDDRVLQLIHRIEKKSGRRRPDPTA